MSGKILALEKNTWIQAYHIRNYELGILQKKTPRAFSAYAGQSRVHSRDRAFDVCHLLCGVPCNAGSCGAFVRSKTARLASRFPRKLGAYHALDPVGRYAGRRYCKEHKAGKHHCGCSLFPDACFLRHDTAHRGYAEGNAESRQFLPINTRTYDDEERVSRHRHGQYSNSGLCHARSYRALHRSLCTLLPVGMTRYTVETDDQKEPPGSF